MASNSSTVATSKSKRNSKAAEEVRKQYAKQRNRRIPTGTLPSPSLNIPLDSYMSFVNHLAGSTRILALLGAGLSAASGIPTFRGAGGFWRQHDATQLATPEAFAQNPSLLWQFYNHRRHSALKAVPNKAHTALAKLAAKRPEYLAISQNIDGMQNRPICGGSTLKPKTGLSQRAKHPSENLQPVHGSLFDVKCTKSECTYFEADNFADPIVPALELAEDYNVADVEFPLMDIPANDLPHCPQCGSILRPAVVWFGEPLPRPAIDRIHQWLDGGKVDLMLVVGTSATVWPAANYIHAARVAGARIAVFNIEKPEEEEEEDPVIGLREQDWFFEGDAAAMIPDLLKEVIGTFA